MLPPVLTDGVQESFKPSPAEEQLLNDETKKIKNTAKVKVRMR